MALSDLLTRVDELQSRIATAGPLSSEAKRKLDYRFRLDWNYHSNVLEGSSLTKQETRTIMLGNVTVDGKPIKDVLEMQGHDEVVVKLLQMVGGELDLSEARIKEVHKAIVHEDDPKKKEWIGKWKTEPNHLLNYRGERFDFTPPNEVAEAMHQLLDRTKAAVARIERKEKNAPHPAVLAFDFHREYVTIHPFHDGNGRTARIFSNLLLMRFGFAPVIIKVEEKESYGRFLAEVQAYGAKPDLFNEFMAERLIRSQELVIDAIEGKELIDKEDLDKRLQLLEKKFDAASSRSSSTHSTLQGMLDLWAIPLLHSLLPVITRFDKYFDHSRHELHVNGQINLVWHSGEPQIDRNEVEKALERRGPKGIQVTAVYTGFKHADVERLNFAQALWINFGNAEYSVGLLHLNTREPDTWELARHTLDYHLPQADQEHIVQRFGAGVLDQMEKWSRSER